MSIDRALVALILVCVPCMVLNWNKAEDSDSPFASILGRLRHECDPANPEADYSMSQSTMPTERKREAIIADCRKIGPKLLPKVLQQIKHETDNEVRSMLLVIAAALGDGNSIKPAGQEMAWSDSPAVRISAAKTLRRLQDRRSIEWFLVAVDDDHFVVNGACGVLREKFYPVRNIARMAMNELAALYPDDRAAKQWRFFLFDMTPFESVEQRTRRWAETRRRELEAQVEAEYRKRQGR